MRGKVTKEESLAGVFQRSSVYQRSRRVTDVEKQLVGLGGRHACHAHGGWSDSVRDHQAGRSTAALGCRRANRCSDIDHAPAKFTRRDDFTLGDMEKGPAKRATVPFIPPSGRGEARAAASISAN